MSTSDLHIQLDENLKQEIDSIFAQLGLTTQEAFIIFAKAVVRNQGMPFSLTLNTLNEHKNSSKLTEDDLLHKSFSEAEIAKLQANGMRLNPTLIAALKLKNE